MHDRILGVEIIVVTGITGTGIEEGYPFENAVDLAVGMPKNDDPGFRMAFSQVFIGSFKSETMTGIMHQVEKVLRDGYMTVREGQFDTIKDRLQDTGKFVTV